MVGAAVFAQGCGGLMRERRAGRAYTFRWREESRMISSDRMMMVSVVRAEERPAS